MSADINLLDIGEKLKLNEGHSLRNSDFISDLTNKKYEFVSVIESLNDVLTNQDVVIRERGVSFLSWILTEIPSDLFNSQEISAVATFYGDRLNDHHSIAPATISGLLAIVKMKNIQNDSIRQLLMPLFQEINCQTLEKSDRYKIFSTIAHLVENHFEAVAAMGFDFVLGIISLADGETDPSNLLLLFQFLPLFLKNIELGHLMEEMFDLLSCYFPIDYNAAGRNGSITRQDLTEGLMNCLTARSDFADLCLPLIFDKLDSTLKVAKIDAYKLLGACCSTFSTESITKHSNEIWKIMQKDVLPVTDGQISEAALYALSEIVNLFASSESENQTLKIFLDDIMNSIKTFLNKVEDNLFHPAMNILMAVSSKSFLAAKYVIPQLRFIVSMDSTTTPNQKKIALSSLVPFLSILKYCKIDNSPESDLVAIFNDVSKFYLNSVSCKDSEVRRLAFLGLQELVDNFNDTLRSELLEVIANFIKTENNENRTECLKLLRQLARIAPSEVLKFVESNFQVRVGSSNEGLDLNIFATTISAIAGEETITQYAIPKIMNIITNSIYFDVGLSSLLNSFKMVDDCNQYLKTVHQDFALTETLITWWVNDVAGKKPADCTSVGNLSEIIALIVRNQETCVQQSIVERLVPVLLPEIGSISSERNIFLIEAVLGSVKQNVGLDKYPSLVPILINLALKSNDEKVRISSSRLLASIVNKAGGSLPEWLTDTCDGVFSSLNDTTPIVDKINGICFFNWIVKGLLLADSPHLALFISKWFDLLEREDIGPIVADGFRTVLREESLYLNLSSHCNVKILYRQRFFTYFPVIMKKFESSEGCSKINYLLALVWLIEAVPKHVIVTEITSVVLVLCQALDSGNPDAISVSTRVLQELLQDKEPILVDYVNSFIPKFLKLARFDGYMKIRMSALKCLYLYAYYPTVSLLPVRNEVVRNLEPCLDDKKRLVRSEAVRSRNRWFLVGAPGEDEIFS